MKEFDKIPLDEIMADLYRDCDYALPDWSQALWRPNLKRAYFLGGRGGAKSRTIAAYIILRMMDDHISQLNPSDPLNVLCTREHQNSIKDSVYDELTSVIHILGYQSEFKITKDEITHIKSGGKIIFMGLWQSFQKQSGKGKFNIKLTWVEEANAVSEESIRMLEPSVLREVGSQIIYTSNVAHETDAVYLDAGHYQSIKDPTALILRVNYNNNPFLNDEFIRFIVSEKIRDPEFFRHNFLGEPLKNSEFDVFRFNKHYTYGNLDRIVQENNLTPMYGMDFANSENAPTVLVEFYRLHDIPGYEDTFYISNTRHEYDSHDRHIPALIYGDPQHKFDNWENPRGHTGLIHPSLKKSIPIYVDKSGTNAIKELTLNNINVIAPPKPTGCVLKRINFLQRHKLVINDEPISPSDPTSQKQARRCELMIEEALRYKYAVLTGTKDIPDTTKFVKAHDHSWDALGYGVNPFIEEEEKDNTGAVAIGRFR